MSEPRMERGIGHMEHIPALDGVRGLAVLLVLQVHVGLLGPYMLPAGARGDTGFARLIDGSRGMWIGVDLFFVLSGFLITSILLRSAHAEGGVRAFYIRRALRIVPVYYVFLLLLFYVLPLAMTMDGIKESFVYPPRYQPSFWLFYSNIPWSFVATADPGTGPVHLWSIAVEEQFYLLWPLVLLAFARRWLAWVSVALFVGAFAIRCAIVVSGDAVFTDASTYYLTFTRMDALAAGALLACLRLNQFGASHRRWAFAAGAVAALAVALIWRPSEGLDVFQPEVRTIGFSAIAVMFAAFVFLVLTSRGGRLDRVLGHRVMRDIGKYSYAVYLFHLPIYVIVADEVIARGGLNEIWGSYLPALLLYEAAVIAITFAVAWVSWHLLERPVLSLKRYFPYGGGAGGGSRPLATAPARVPHEGRVGPD